MGYTIMKTIEDKQILEIIKRIEIKSDELKQNSDSLMKLVVKKIEECAPNNTIQSLINAGRKNNDIANGINMAMDMLRKELFLIRFQDSEEFQTTNNNKCDIIKGDAIIIKEGGEILGGINIDPPFEKPDIKPPANRPRTKDIGERV